MSSVFEHLDQAVDRLATVRDELLVDPYAVDRAARLAAVFESEACAWSQVYELSCRRLSWRAALAAEAGARMNAAVWARRAVQDRAADATAESRAAGRVGAPRPAALTTSNRGGGR